MKRFNIEVKTGSGVQLVLTKSGTEQTETVTVSTDALQELIAAGVYATAEQAKEDVRANVEYLSVQAAYKLLGLPYGYRLTADETKAMQEACAQAVDSLVPSVDALFI